MKQQIERLSKAALWVVGVIVLFKALEGCFWLMSTRSTIQNIGGLILFALIITAFLLFTINKIKTK